jgi:transcriptional regulator with XRE-family HTH domain
MPKSQCNRHTEKKRREYPRMPEPPQFQEFGPRLRWWREERRKIKQGVLANKIGIAQASLSELEKGHSKQPSAEVLLNLADALGLRPRYLLTGTGPAEGLSMTELSGTEAQLVMVFRQFPTDHLREAFLLDAYQMLERRERQTAPTAVPAFAPVPTPAPSPAVNVKAVLRSRGLPKREQQKPKQQPAVRKQPKGRRKNDT